MLISVGVMSIILTGCGSQSSDSSDSTTDQEISELREIERNVMEVHDEVMPKMADLNNIIKRLKTSREDIEESAEMTAKIQTAIADLVAADSLMWDWMYNYKRPDYEGDLDSARMYLVSEQERVTVVKESMLSSMERGEQLLEKLSDK